MSLDPRSKKDPKETPLQPGEGYMTPEQSRQHLANIIKRQDELDAAGYKYNPRNGTYTPPNG